MRFSHPCDGGGVEPGPWIQRLRAGFAVFWGALVLLAALNHTFLARMGAAVPVPDWLWIARYGYVMFNHPLRVYDECFLSDPADPAHYRKLSDFVETRSWGYQDSRVMVNGKFSPEWIWWVASREWERRGRTPMRFRMVKTAPLHPAKSREIVIEFKPELNQEAFLDGIDALPF